MFRININLTKFFIIFIGEAKLKFDLNISFQYEPKMIYFHYFSDCIKQFPDKWSFSIIQ